MKIGILSKRTTMLAGGIKRYYEDNGFEVKIYTLKNLIINETLLNNDFYILKSKKLFFLYAGFFLEANNKPVIPQPQISFMLKNRIQSHFFIKKTGLLIPEIYLGTFQTLKNQLSSKDFPLISKPIMGSGSKGVKIIKNLEDLNGKNGNILYLEKFIKGMHYNVYFIDNNICTLIKPPLSNEHVEMEKIDNPSDIEVLIKKWRSCLSTKPLFGHLDIVREESSKELYIVDPGTFPAFTNWKCGIFPIDKICNLILNKAKELIKKNC